MTFRREINQLALRSVIDGIHSFLSCTYVSLTFLLMYGTMLKFDITEITIMGWFTEAIRNIAKYITAEKRIQVVYVFSNYSFEMK
jgi:hypothetical protein